LPDMATTPDPLSIQDQLLCRLVFLLVFPFFVCYDNKKTKRGCRK